MRNRKFENRSTANKAPKSRGRCRYINSASGTILQKDCNIRARPEPPRDCKCYYWAHVF